MNNIILNYGLTEITVRPRSTFIEHRGNMGNSIRDVRHNVDHLLGKGTFDKLQAEGTESGSPDYMYTLKLTRKVDVGMRSYTYINRHNNSLTFYCQALNRKSADNKFLTGKEDAEAATGFMLPAIHDYEVLERKI